jgi:hypothetical protein
VGEITLLLGVFDAGNYYNDSRMLKFDCMGIKAEANMS